MLGHGGPGDRTSTFAIDPTYAYSIDPRIGDGDTIISQGADDIIVGGRGHCDTHDSALPCVDVVDDINAGGGNNIVLGDSGRLGFADGLITSAVSLAPALRAGDGRVCVPIRLEALLRPHRRRLGRGHRGPDAYLC